MVDFLHDVRMENTYEPTEGPSAINEPGEGSSATNEPPETKNELEELLAKASEKLYPGCDKFTLHYLSKSSSHQDLSNGAQSLFDIQLAEENKFEENFPVCGKSRWKNKNTKGKKVTKKVLRYFPLTSRLRRMYNSRHIAKYMTWHATGKCKENVMLTTFNLPPWLCMKESHLMLSMLIPGPKSPGKDMDVFLRPLVEELKTLWSKGVRMRDAATET
ncbi:uncharacterized protein Tco_0040137 [Tanacetum coccineum]